jgi:hypothetical protein
LRVLFDMPQSADITGVRSLVAATCLGILFLIGPRMARPALAQAGVAQDGWVVLPVAEYRALRDRAYPAPRQPEPPPVEASLTRLE